VLIFPEGTRMRPASRAIPGRRRLAGGEGRRAGGAGGAQRRPLLAEERFLKYPGEIVVDRPPIAPPIRKAARCAKRGRGGDARGRRSLDLKAARMLDL
jgi:hypothetical protein